MFNAYTPNLSLDWHLIRIVRLLPFLLFLVLPTYGIARESQQSTFQNGNRVRGYLWSDSNCDGLHQGSDGGVINSITMSLYYIGNDSIPFTIDDSVVSLGGSTLDGTEYFFNNGGGGNTYYIAIRPRDRPTGFIPSLWQQGEDRLIDNDMRLWPDGTWATGTFVIAAQTVTGIDIGLCPVASIPRPYAVALPLVMR